jgi:O-antigen ligase
MEVAEKGVPGAGLPQKVAPKREPLAGAFFWLSAFYVVYCARPEDWIPGLSYLPLAKISAIFALLALVTSVGRSKRRFRDLPKEAKYFFAMVAALFVSALLSPVWKGGAFFGTLDFAKAPIAWVLTFLVITNFERLKRIIFIQSASVALITVISILKGRSHPRLEGVIGGIYSNPNDLAFAIVLSLPFCFAFLLSTRSIARKVAWAAVMLAMCSALFMTASRAGFIDLVVTGSVCLWLFGIKGKRIHLIAAAALVALVVGMAAGGRLKDRFFAISGNDLNTGLEVAAHGSYEQRRALMVESVKAIARYPLGLGLGNFVSYNGTWREVHVSYLQMAAEGGIAALVFYVLFFASGFSNLRRLRRMPSNDPEIELFSGALYATLMGFLVGAFFAPVAYQYFPYFAEGYTAVLLAMAQEREQLEGPSPGLSNRRQRLWKAQMQTGGLTLGRGGPGLHSDAPSRVLRNRP